MEKNTKGVTLIALVITIIVLLILAAISIATLTGENGILTKSNTAKIETEKAGAKEKVQMAVMSSFDNNGKLDNNQLKTNLEQVEGIDKSTIPETITDDTYPFDVTVDGYEATIDKNGKVTVKGETTGGSGGTGTTPTLPSTADTTPYLPTGATIDEEHNNLDNGLVIKDTNNNEWVWIEVPKSIYTNTTYNDGTPPTSSEDYDKIESIMQKYASDYRGSYTDTFCSTEQHGFADEDDYNDWKKSMLKSVYENGGFYIGRYEMGTEEIRTNVTDDGLQTPLIQRDMYPYNWITCKQAQTLSKQLSTGGRQASLMFGIQWDLVLKFIEEKGEKTQAQIKTDSKDWGNNYDAQFTIERGKYSEDGGSIYQNVEGSYSKESEMILLTTGATDRNSVLGICDLAGNVAEWTLESIIDSNTPCVNRGGTYDEEGFYNPVVFRGGLSVSYTIFGVGCRPALW